MVRGYEVVLQAQQAQQQEQQEMCYARPIEKVQKHVAAMEL